MLKDQLHRLASVDHSLGLDRQREAFLLRALEAHFQLRFNRERRWSADKPHYFSQRISAFRFAFASEPAGPQSFFRGFYATEILRPGDRVLDIGCGDGFFAKHFFSATAGHVDAFDVEADAIAAAEAENRAANVKYQRLDAVGEPFPGTGYDLVVWDGALAHFSAADAATVLAKIRASLNPEGVFCGSESIGEDGDDHLQVFRSLSDFEALFKPHFAHVGLKSARYPVGGAQGLLRHEAYWRCTQSKVRANEWAWGGE